MAENLTSKPFAYAQRSGFRRDDYTVEWPDSSVGMLTEGEAKMWAAHMNEAYEAGRRSHEPKAYPHLPFDCPHADHRCSGCGLPLTEVRGALPPATTPPATPALWILDDNGYIAAWYTYDPRATGKEIGTGNLIPLYADPPALSQSLPEAVCLSCGDKINWVDQPNRPAQPPTNALLADVVEILEEAKDCETSFDIRSGVIDALMTIHARSPSTKSDLNEPAREGRDASQGTVADGPARLADEALSGIIATERRASCRCPAGPGKPCPLTEQECAARMTDETFATPCRIAEYDGAFWCTAHDRKWGATTNPDQPCARWQEQL